MNQGETSSELSIIPLKRRRGRPPKDPSLKRIPKRSKQYLPTRPGPMDPTEPRVGQAITGIVEATLDAGYLLNVRIGNSPMSFRGIVFKSGHYIPVTPENDVAPHLQMIKRNDVFTPGSLAIIPPPKRKYKSRRAAVASVPPVHPAGARGNLVPVVLKPVGFPNGSELGFGFGEKDVEMVEPLTMLPPNTCIPSTQGERVEGLSGVENRGSSETSDSLTENGKEGLISPSLSGTVLTQEVGNDGNGGLLNGVTVTKPFFDCGPGRMTDLLQAVEMKESQVHFAEQPVPGSEAGLRERVMKIETDLNIEGSGP